MIIIGLKLMWYAVIDKTIVLIIECYQILPVKFNAASQIIITFDLRGRRT